MPLLNRWLCCSYSSWVSKTTSDRSSRYTRGTSTAAMKKIIIKGVIACWFRIPDQVPRALACPIIRIWQHGVKTCAHEYFKKTQSTQDFHRSRVRPYLQRHFYWGISIGKKSLGTFGHADSVQQYAVPRKGTLPLVYILHYFARVWAWLPEDICWHFQTKMDWVFCGCVEVTE